MKCSVCGSTNMIKIDEYRKGQFKIEDYGCKDCCHIDSYCFDFKKRNELEDLVHKLLSGIKELRLKSLGNKKELLQKYYDAVSLIRINYPSEEITIEINNINKALRDIDDYLDVDKLMKIETQDGYDENFNAIKKDIYYIGDFPINYKDCVNGHSIFFFMSNKKYKDLHTVTHHDADTTVLDIMTDYYETEPKNHIFYPLNEEIKTKKWYIEASKDQKLYDSINTINQLIELFK